MRPFYQVTGAILLVVFIAGCVTPPRRHQAAGTVVGAATGAIIGGSMRNNPGDAVIGGAIGALVGAMVGRDIDEGVRRRVADGQPLTLEDVKALSKAKVGDDLIISQIKSTRTVYRLSSAQIIDLKNAGVSQKVIEFMIKTKTTKTTTTVVVPAPVPVIPGPDYIGPFPEPGPPPPPPHHHRHP